MLTQHSLVVINEDFSAGKIKILGMLEVLIIVSA
jgi:hypothetical protein